MAQRDLTKLEGRLHTAVTSARRRSRPGRYGRTEWPCAETPNEAALDFAARNIPRHTRRLSDKVLIAFHQACDTSDLEIAADLLRVLEVMLARRPTHADGNRRRNVEGLVAAYERLWHLRHLVVDQ